MNTLSISLIIESSRRKVILIHYIVKCFAPSATGSGIILSAMSSSLWTYDNLHFMLPVGSVNDVLKWLLEFLKATNVNTPLTLDSYHFDSIHDDITALDQWSHQQVVHGRQMGCREYWACWQWIVLHFLFTQRTIGRVWEIQYLWKNKLKHYSNCQNSHCLQSNKINLIIAPNYIPILSGDYTYQGVTRQDNVLNSAYTKVLEQLATELHQLYKWTLLNSGFN